LSFIEVSTIATPETEKGEREESSNHRTNLDFLIAITFLSPSLLLSGFLLAISAISAVKASSLYPPW
jgi:hypothetical protein